MKSFPFIVCIVAGLYVGYFIGKNNPVEVPVDNRKQSEAITSIDENASEEIGLLRKQIADLQQEQTSLTEQLHGYEEMKLEKSAARVEMKRKFIEIRMKDYEGILDLTSDQKERIGEIEWAQFDYNRKFRSGEYTVKDKPFANEREEIERLLSDGQRKIYADYIDARIVTAFESIVVSKIGQIPVTVGISIEQRKEISENLYGYLHPDSGAEARQRWENLKQRSYDREDQLLLWAAKDVLEEEQYLALLQSLKK